MVYVRLDANWTDAEGRNHAAGESIDVDAATLARLQAEGNVSETSNGSGNGQMHTDWLGPTTDKP